MAVVFAKTEKGQAEVATKAAGLSPRVRRVLIMIDGKRSIDELRSMLQSDDLQHTLGMLEEDGFIELTGAKNPAPLPLPSLFSFSDLPPNPDPVRLQQARNFMANTLNAFVGALGTSALLDRIENAQTHDDLRAQYDEWYHAIVMSRDGKREAEALRSKLLAVI